MCDDFSQFNLTELLEMNKKMQAAIDKEKQLQIKQFQQEMLAFCSKANVSLLELALPLLKNDFHFVKKRKTPGKGAVLFRHPENTSWVWSGKGRRPQWIEDWLRGGGRMESLHVQDDDFA